MVIPQERTVQADKLAPGRTGTRSENLAHFVRMDPRRKGLGGQTVYRTGTLKDRCEPILLFECCLHMIREAMWVGAAAAAIKDMGAEKFLRLLLENLKGNYVAA